MPTADFILKLTAGTRAAYGAKLTIGGKLYSMTTRTLEKREREYIPDGLENAASSDLRIFSVTPTDFPVWPPLGSTLSWQGIFYTVIAVRPGDDALGQTIITLLFFCYKTPTPESDTAETPSESSPGQRKEYWPAPSAL